jgi:soluble lytic murein transglycosylase-like protein
VLRNLTDEEKIIHKLARVFNESEFEMPSGFARSVRDMIDQYWKTPAGVDRLTRSIQKAEKSGYTGRIVRTMRKYGLPPQLFYLALQESNFDVKAIGPPTRWGRAKGMWQFIPSTARRYGIDPGPYADDNLVDPHDERHDFEKSTDAAARYLQTIYSTLAQASGLLAIASYNWGEHRVANKLETLPGPQAIPKEALEGIPENPKDRNYWRFLREYRDRMPDETKDYVLKIFSAAVIGEDPQRFGFNFENPLGPYLEKVD